MMPEMDGQEALKQIRQLERGGAGIDGGEARQGDHDHRPRRRDNVLEAIQGQCDYFLVKPIDGRALLEELRRLGLIPDMAPHLAGTGVTMNLLDPGWLRTDLGGPEAPNAVESVLPGALEPLLVEDGTCGKWFSAQDYR
jgi:hypothetical protein